MPLISRQPHRFHRSRSQGFSLIELAIGLVIVATLLSALLVPLATQMDQQRAAETRRQLDTARDALMGFAASHGRLPCPATSTSNGVEAFLNPPTGNPSNGECASALGLLPAVTLGLSPLDDQGFYRDAYGTENNRIRYAVSLSNVNRYTNSIDCGSRGTGPVAVIRPLTTSPGPGGGTTWQQPVILSSGLDVLGTKRKPFHLESCLDTSSPMIGPPGVTPFAAERILCPG
jgi:prepilin-type N-terminal cleavage/methylation domain-containing protein